MFWSLFFNHENIQNWRAWWYVIYLGIIFFFPILSSLKITEKKSQV